MCFFFIWVERVTLFFFFSSDFFEIIYGRLSACRQRCRHTEGSGLDFHQRAFQREVLPVSAWVPQLPLGRLNIRIIGNPGLSVGVSAVGCLSVCVAMNLHLVLGLPRLDPQTSWMDSSTQRPRVQRWKTDGLSSCCLCCHSHVIPVTSISLTLLSLAALRCQFAVVSFSRF